MENKTVDERKDEVQVQVQEVQDEVQDKMQDERQSEIKSIKIFRFTRNTESKDESHRATMNDLVKIITPQWKVPCENLNEVFPGIFLGDEIAAKDVNLLKHIKVTHILNAAYSEKNSFLFVNTSHSYYKDREFECSFLGVSAVDCPTYKLSKYFQQACDFIEMAANRPDGKILVHCRQGVSRSATFVLVYLMIKKKMTAKEAVTLVRNKRNIFPNQGFLKEICDFENQLFKLNHYDSRNAIKSNDNGSNDSDTSTSCIIEELS